MKISEKQLQFMYQVLIDSLCIVGTSSPFKYSQDLRVQYADQILMQQSEKLKEVTDEN